MIATMALAASGLTLAAASPAAAAPQDLDRTPVSPTPVANVGHSAACTPITVYVSRGSSENDTSDGAKYVNGVGEEMTPFVNSFRALYPAGTVTVTANVNPGYPAVGITFDPPFPVGGYVPSVAAGADQGAADLTAIRTACPSTRLVVVGYSEGAEVARRAVARVTPPPAGQAVTLLFGDVWWKAGEAGVRYVGDVSSNENGLIREVAAGHVAIVNDGATIPPLPALPAGWNTISYCHGGDPACQWPGPLDPVLNAHLNYDDTDHWGAAVKAARSLTGVTASAPLPVATIASATSACIGGSGPVPVALAAGSAAATFSTIWEPFDFAPANTTTLAANGSTTISIARPGVRLKTVVNGQKIEYKNAC
jgi:hypothetical protein